MILSEIVVYTVSVIKVIDMTPNESSSTPTPETTPVTPIAPAVNKGIGLKDLLIPISIVIAGAFVGTGFFLSGTGKTAPTPTTGTQQPSQEQPADMTSKVSPVTDEDWFRGSPDAPIVIVEYSDYDCPFCSRFHSTMNTVVESSNGQVAWVYRHFPLEQLHPQAGAVASAAECVGELGGDEAFWEFSDAYFAARGAGDATAHNILIPQIVTDIGVNRDAFSTCFESERHADKIQADFTNAAETGGRGTPWSILIAPDGKTYPINGAQTPQAVQQLIDFVLQGA